MAEPVLQKNIGLWSATSIVIGSIIGSSIFMKPATMAAQLGSPWLMLLVWLVAGIISLFGAMAFAELGTMFPETGGQYVYLRYAYGDLMAYLYGWSSVAVINTAAIAAMGFVLASYAGYFIPLPKLDAATEQSIVWHIPFAGDLYPLKDIGIKALGILVTGVMTAVNYVSVKYGNLVQLLATLFKVLAIVLLIFGILFSGKGDTLHFIRNAQDFGGSFGTILIACMAATTGAFAAYDGWNNLPMVAGELKSPEKNITRSLLMGIWVCITVYMLVTLAYLYVLPVEVMRQSPLVASDATAVVLGNSGGTVIAVLIMVSCLGAMTVNLLSNARVVFAMAEAKQFFAFTGKVHPRFQTPGNAVLVLGIWSAFLIVSGSFDMLADMFIFTGWVFYGLVVTGLFILRKKMPDAERPYRVWGFPYMPLLFVLFTAVYVATTIYSDIDNYVHGKSHFINSVTGLIITALGIPLYYYFRWKNKGKQVG